MPPRAPVAPSIERSSLVLWLGDGQAAMLDDLDRSVVGAVAVSLPQAARNATALTRARRDLGLGLMPDLESWRLQLALDHPLRGPAWRALGMDGGKVFKPDARRISEAAAERQGTRAMDAQTNNFDPTIFTTPAHWLPEDQAGVGRRNDLALAQACADIFARRDLAEPPDDDPHRHRRRLYASLMVDAGRLRRGDVEWILDAYCDLAGVDGYVVWAVRFNRGLLQARLLRALTDVLQQRPGRPVIAGGLWHFHKSALTRGLAATCVGPGRGMYPMLPPPEPEEPDETTDKPKGRAVCVYHGAILGSFGLRKSDDARRRRAFMRHACPCGAHPAQEPPATHEQIVAHNRFWLMHEARQALEQPRARSAARLAARIPDARRARADLGMTGLAACWSDLSAPGRSAATG
jgi:hypothetical protein